jgi:hypothetical protein
MSKVPMRRWRTPGSGESDLVPSDLCIPMPGPPSRCNERTKTYQPTFEQLNNAMPWRRRIPARYLTAQRRNGSIRGIA